MTDKQPSIVNRGDLIKFWAKIHPDRPVVICGDQRLTWAELNQRGRALASSLYGLGLRPGDRACVMIYNLPQFWEISVGLGILGVGSVPIGYRSQAPEIEYIANNSEAKAVLFYHEFADRILPHKDKYPGLIEGGFICIGETDLPGATEFEKLFDDPPAIDLDNLPDVRGQGMIYTSGTTGKPKGAARRATEAMADFLRHIIGQFKYTVDEVHLVACPLYHSAPIAFSGVAFAMGGTLVLMPRFDTREFLENIARHKVTSSFIVPTILDSILKEPEEFVGGLDLSSLRALICGAAPLFPRIKLGILDRLGPVLYEFYGSTETGVNTIITPEEIREKPDSVGRAFPDNELIVLDEKGEEVPDGERGELYIYNPFLMEGYYKNEKATRECFHDKYMSVGDIAIRDEDGYYYIVDRKKDMIIRGGVNIYPAEIEDVIHGMEGVRDVAVVGMPDEHWGEKVAAFVVAEPGSEISEESIKDYCEDKMATQKIPEVIRFREDIPRSPQGKILKKNLRQEL
jgi:fatty-acyl-CoA synthase